MSGENVEIDDPGPAHFGQKFAPDLFRPIISDLRQYASVRRFASFIALFGAFVWLN